MPQTITITSGKGGVGKTNISVNLAVQLAARGQRVCLFDADLGLANVNILLGLYPELNLSHVIDGRHCISDILIHYYRGVDIVPGSSGISKLANLTPDQIHPVLASLSAINDYDVVLFDTSTGAGGDVTAFCRAASQMLLVITPEPTSLTDAYSLLKVLVAQGFDKPVRVLVNKARNLKHAKIAYQSLSRAAAKHLEFDLSAIGFIVRDPLVVEAVKQQKPFSSVYPRTIATKCIQKIADRLTSDSPKEALTENMRSFWLDFLSLRQHSERDPALAERIGFEPDIKEIKDRLQAIETELKALHATMRAQKDISTPNAAASPRVVPPAGAPAPPPIPLDFEAFLKEKRSSI